MPYQPRVAILVPAPDYYEKWQPAFARKAAALTAAGLIVEQRVWTDPGDLAGYDLILPLFAWGYQRDVALWYALLDRLESAPTVDPRKYLGAARDAVAVEAARLMRLLAT